MNIIISNDVLLPLCLSIKVAFYATLINIFFSIPFAYLLAKKNNFFTRLLDIIATLPMVFPPTVLGYYLLVIFGSHGAIGIFLKKYFNISLIFTLNGAIIAAAIITFPLVLKPSITAFQSVDEKLEQVGRVLGVSELGIFFRVTLPLAINGIVSGILLGFVRSLGEFGATLMIAGSIPGKTQTLSIAIYEAVQAGKDSLANYLVLIIVIICVIFLLGINFLLKPKN